MLELSVSRPRQSGTVTSRPLPPAWGSTRFAPIFCPGTRPGSFASCNPQGQGSPWQATEPMMLRRLRWPISGSQWEPVPMLPSRAQASHWLDAALTGSYARAAAAPRHHAQYPAEPVFRADLQHGGRANRRGLAISNLRHPDRPIFAAFAMSASSISVMLNSLRLRSATV
jgi:hypothetical protein